MDEDFFVGMLDEFKKARELPDDERESAEQRIAFEFYARNSARIRNLYKNKTGRSFDGDESLLTDEQAFKPIGRIRSWFQRCVEENRIIRFKWMFVVQEIIKDLAANAKKDPLSAGVDVTGIAGSTGGEQEFSALGYPEPDTSILDIIDKLTDTPHELREVRKGVFLRRQLLFSRLETPVERSDAPRQSSPDVYTRRRILLRPPP